MIPSIKEINARKHHLESREKREPDRDFSAEWLELAGLYESVGSNANRAYCLNRVEFYAKRHDPPPPAVAPDGHYYGWQEWTD